MALKSYRLKLKKKGKKPKPKGFVTGAVGAIIGTAFVAQTANVLTRL